MSQVSAANVEQTMRYTPSDLWCIQTSNNTDSFDWQNEELFTSEAEAAERCDHYKAVALSGRTDYVVRNAADALQDAAR